MMTIITAVAMLAAGCGGGEKKAAAEKVLRVATEPTFAPFEFHKEGKMPLCIIAGSLALLFQPFVKITLDKITWNVIDVLVAIALILLWYKNKEQQ